MIDLAGSERAAQTQVIAIYYDYCNEDMISRTIFNIERNGFFTNFRMCNLNSFILELS